MSHKRSYQSTFSYIRVFSILPTRCHTKGPTNQQVLIYGSFTVLCSRCHTKSPANLEVLIYGILVYCLPGVTQKVLPIYMFLYTGFCVLSTRCHTKDPTNLQVLMYGFLAYCLPGVTQKVIQIYRFLYIYFQCIAYQVSHKRSYQDTGSYIQAFSVLSTRWHRKGPTNLQVLVYGFLLYCLPRVTQKVLPIYSV